MKKFFLVTLLGFGSLFALPIGNPMDASLYRSGLFWTDCYEDSCDICDPCFSWIDALSFRIGFYGDYVFERNLELKNQGKKDIAEFEIDTNAAYIALNICNQFDIFATLGTSRFELRANPILFNSVSSTPSLLLLRTRDDFSWSIGGRLTLWNFECLYFGIEGQYFYSKPDVFLAEIPGGALTFPDDNIRLKYEEWQVGIGASYLLKIGCSGISAVPYIGLKWSGECAKFDNAVIVGNPTSTTATLFDLTNNKLWGYGIGVTFVFCDLLTATVEGRFGDERAVHVNSQFRF